MSLLMIARKGLARQIGLMGLRWALSFIAMGGVSVCSQGVNGQSTLLFRNGIGGGIPRTPVLDGDTGEPLAVVGNVTPFTVQLYWSSTEPSLPIDLKASDNRTSTFAAPGIFFATNTGLIPADPGNYWFQVKIWETDFGSTFEEASLQPGAKVGESNIFMLQTVAFGADFPLALSQGGLESFTVSAIPEPSSMMLLLVGAGALLGVRKRITSATSR